MKTNRVFNNFFSSILSQIVTLAFAIVIPRLILVNLGSEANGLLSTIDQILVYVGLLEAGIGVASLQSLYGAFGKNDTNKVSSIVSATNTLYHKTGTAYFFVVVLLSVVSPFFISSDIENNVITTTFLLCGLPGAINYFFQGKYKILLEADGRKYIITNVNLVVKIASSIIKIILLLNGFGIVALQIGFLSLSIAQMLFYLVYIRQKYRWLNLRAAPDYSALSNSKYVILHNVAGLIFTNTDIVILSVFCGLKTVSVYSLYAMVFSIVSTILSHFESADFIFGQTFNNDRERYLKLHDVYELYNMALTFSLFCVANILIIPFMRIYTEGVTDTNYVDSLLPYLFVTTFLLQNARSSSLRAIKFAQHFKQTQDQVVIEMIINLVVSVLCVKVYGIYGVLFGTIAGLIYRSIAMIVYANIAVLKRSPMITIKRWIRNIVLYVIVILINRFLFSLDSVNTYVEMFVYAVLYTLVLSVGFFCVNSFVEREEFIYLRSIVKSIIKKHVN